MIDFLGKIKALLQRLVYTGTGYSLQVARRVLPPPFQKFIRKILYIGERGVIIQNQRMLRQVLRELQPDKDYRSMIIFPPSLDWDVQLFQRPQQLALALAKQGALVFYIQPKPDRKQQPFQLIRERLYLCNVHVDTFRVLSNPLIYLLTWNSGYASRFRNPRILYDFVDDINVFYGDHQQIVRGHQYLLQHATIVLATASKLVEEARLHRPDVIYSPNGVAYEHFSRTVEEDLSSPPPKDMQPILSPSHPIIGYYGALARWFDYELLKSVASLRSTYQFVLIGPDYDGTLKPSDLNEITNIHLLGVKSYDELPNYLKCFDVAIIPFIVNEITHATSPLKLFEYMAGGKPIVITPMQESMQYEGVLAADKPEEFAAKLDCALSLRNDAQYIEKIKRIARLNTWESRAEQILRQIEMIS